ncbi:MAG: hypothetical protein DMF66_00700 [Acidobacteria bacterium]|nr:MAG: hypothetical protein DMF66_00700 [Acidobacteriota bacterium]
MGGTVVNGKEACQGTPAGAVYKCGVVSRTKGRLSRPQIQTTAAATQPRRGMLRARAA